jgi:hypothetical protein
VLEPLPLGTLRALASPAPLAGLLFLVIFGTVAAYTIYLRLVRDWGAPHARSAGVTSSIVIWRIGNGPERPCHRSSPLGVFSSAI